MPVTRESVEAAKRDTANKREEIFRATGVRITDDGRIVTKAQS